MLAALLLVATGFAVTGAAPPPREDARVEAFTLAFNGKYVTAKRVLEQALRDRPDRRHRVAYRSALLTICIDALDDVCLKDHVRRFADDALDSSEGELGMSRPMIARQVGYFLSYNAYRSVDLAPHRSQLFGTFIDTANEAPAEMDLYVKRHLLCAGMYVELREFRRAASCVDKALSLLASLANPEENKLLLLDSLANAMLVLVEMGEIERALGLYRAATRASGPPHTMNHLRFRLAEANILEKTGDLAGAKAVLDKAAAVLDMLELEPDARAELRNILHLPRAALCTLLADQPCAFASLQAVPFHAVFERRAKAPSNGPELAYLAARAFADAAFGRKPDPRIGRAMADGLSFGVPGVTDDELLAYRSVAIGLSSGQSQSAPHYVVSARHLIAAVRAKPPASLGSWYRPGIVDRIFLMLALQTEKPASPAELRTLFHASQLIGRNVASFRMDELGALSNARDETSRRAIRDALRARSARDRAERLLIGARVARAAAQSGNAAAPRHDEKVRSALLGLAGLATAEEAGLSASADPAGLAELGDFQAVLHDGEVALLVAPTFGARLAYMCVRRDEARYFIRPADLNQIQLDARLIQAGLTATHAPSDVSDRQFPVAASMRLYDALIRPFEGCIRPGDEINWLHGVYSLNLPLGILLKEPPPREGSGYDLSKARWLVRDHVLSYAGSPSLLLATRRAARFRPRPSGSFLGVGDPVFTSPSDPRDEPVRAELRRLKALPETRTELRRSAEPFAGARLLLGPDASEAAVRGQLGNPFLFLSFATHAVIRDELPGLGEAALVLSHGSGQSGDDGLLRASEIAALDLQSAFVALSACNTANYDIETLADEIPALALAFAVAGVPATLATLWPVDSSTSEQVVAPIFADLNRGATPSAALARSQRQFLATNRSVPRFHPRFWAPFVILGDGGLAPPGMSNTSAGR